ncbi:unnamed protein product [Triticum turgidum subsp. durum]|uniref:Ubiquitin-like domain-containing protein n=1 Tax=Triticum turgidum subsp. durum TaxID=4567 RepID=A0A9R0TUD0_TRITD|nr:unnamed protein product [Triticum turgidum subsp. durum]
MKETTSPVSPAAAAKEALKEDEWEVRPGGMLVQKRDPGSDAPAGAPVPTIRLKVKFNAVSHEIYISSQASFGDVKKMMSEKTGLHHEDQKVLYKGKEMDSKAFLDMSGVKDRSKLALLEDPDAQAKRLIEQRRADKAHRASKSVSRISLDVDKLATKVSALEAIVRKGGKVVEADVVALTEALMTELVKLDAIAADGEARNKGGSECGWARKERGNELANGEVRVDFSEGFPAMRIQWEETFPSAMRRLRGVEEEDEFRQHDGVVRMMVK